MTVPLGVLKQGLPRFSQALPPDRLAAIERLGFGRAEKALGMLAEAIGRPCPARRRQTPQIPVTLLHKVPGSLTWFDATDKRGSR